MKSPISLTNKAIQKIKQLTINSNKFALRLDLKKGGCAGMETLWSMLIRWNKMRK